MLYGLVFYLNLYPSIVNQLGMITIITLFHLLKVLNSFPLMNYTQVLLSNLWLADLQYFPLTLLSQWK